MTPTDLLLRLRELDVRIWVEGDQLRYSPEETLSDELRAELAAQESDLVGFLRSVSPSAAAPRKLAIERVSRDQDLVLSFSQQRFWFLSLMGGQGSAYNMTLALRLRGALDVDALTWSLDEIVRRHEILRTTFRTADGEAVQVVAPHQPLELSPVDLTEADDPQSEADRLTQAEFEHCFDLTQGPLIRFTLLRPAASEYVLLATTHHVIADRWSYGVLCEELTSLYEARLAGRQSPLEDPRVQYADCAAWQRRHYDDHRDELVNYWRGQLSGAPTLDLPTDRPRPPEQSFEGAKSAAVLPKDVTDGLKELARKEGCTFFMAMLAAFKVLLARHSGQDDIVVGTPAANRREIETEKLIGPFLNNLVLRTSLEGGPSFRELLRRVREVSLGADQHGEMPFEQLVVELAPRRDLSRNPLFQVLFNLLNEAPPPVLKGVEMEPIVPETVSSPFDLSLVLDDAPDGVKVVFQYSSDLFDAATIERMQGQLQVVIEEAVRAPDRSVRELSLLTADERRALEDQGTARDYPRESCYHELFEAQAASTPDAVAVSCDGEALTYGELNARANQLAHHLRSLGAAPDQLVGISVERSVSMLVGLLGILKSGAAYVPLDPAYPNDRLAFIMEDAGLQLLVTQESLRAELPDSLPNLVRLDEDHEEIAAHSADNPERAAGPDHLAYVIFTSGSTGKPKGVQIEHRALVNFLATMADRPGVTADDVLVAVTTISFDIAGLELYLPLMVGARVEIAGGGVEGDGLQLAELLSSSGATIMQATPATWRLLIEAGWSSPDLKALCGGEALPRELAELLIPRCAELWNMYGPTETTIWSLVSRVLPGDGQVPIGAPIANTEVWLLDQHQQPAPAGVTGELWLGGDGLARGYWNRPELTEEKFIEHPFSSAPGARLYNTGDVARYRNDGTLEFLGRVDHQVKIRGFRIELGEIEHVLSGHAAVSSCAVVVQTKRSGEKHLAAHLIVEEGQAATASELQAFLREALPDYMVPPAYVVREEMPLTPNGKVDRKALAESEAPRLGSSEGHLPPRTETEKLVAEIWSELLEVDQVGRNDNFFDLGGHSLLILQLRRKLQEAEQVEMTIAEFFQYPTVAAMAAHISGGGDGPSFARVHDRVARRRSAQGVDAIAVVGMAGRFPGARDLDELWDNLREGRETISTFTDEELSASGIDPAVFQHPDYVKRRAILDDVELFDAAFFGVPAREAEAMDPQHRVLLECAWQALESAGYDPLRCPGAVGVFAGSAPNSYLQNNVSRNAELAAASDAFQFALSNYGGGFLATRVAYKLNLEGPAVEVQTACSTSMVAVVQACQSLTSFQCDMALAGGVAIGVPQRVGYLYQEGLIFSPDGHCRPFDSGAQGVIGGEGAGLVLLKRLDDAIADGDQIRAVIRGAAINNDGSNKVGFTAPSVDGQAAVIAEALAQSEVDPATIGYVEAHGTATPLGDPIEIAALTRAYRSGTQNKGYCAIGSVKSNFGHADAAAGVAGLIKTVLALENAEIPPTLHFDERNPEIDFEGSPFKVAVEATPWKTGSVPRRAGVSSFGFGGTNAHVVLEEAPAAAAAEGSRPEHLLVLSAKTEEALAEASKNLAAHLEGHPEMSLADVAFTTQQSRGGLLHRRAVGCSSSEEAIAALRGADPVRVSSGMLEDEDPPTVFMFPGQGAQYVGMGRQLYDSEPVFRRSLDTCAELLRPHLEADIREVLFSDEDGAADQLQQTRLTQPVIFAVEYSLAQLWIHWGVKPAAMIGHSIGEYVAACLAGVFTLEDSLELVAARGRMMQDLPAGDMLSVSLPEEEVRPLLGADVSLAAVNGPGSCVVSGPAAAIQRLRDDLESRDVACTTLHTSHAFHSAMMDPIVEPFRALVSKAQPAPASLPCVSTVTGDWVDAEDWADPAYWARNLREPVRFADGASALLGDDRYVFIEVGPGQTLSTLMRQQGERVVGRTVVASMHHPREPRPALAFLLGALGRLWLAGVPVAWANLHDGQPRRRVVLPTYPFERERYWIEPTTASLQAPSALPTQARKADLADWFHAPLWRQSVPPADVPAAADERWLVFVDDCGVGEQVIAQLEGMPVCHVRPGAQFGGTAEGSYELRPGHREDYDALCAALAGDGGLPTRVLHLWGVVAQPGDLEQSQARGFRSVVALAQALGGAAVARVAIDVVSNGLYGVTADEAFAPERATALGACAVVPQELPLVACRSVDVDREINDAAAVAAQLLADARSDGGDPVVAYRGHRRWVPTYEPLRIEASEAAPRLLRDGGVYLITGGLGGIGLALADQLVDTVGAKLVLVGRSGLPPTDERAAWIAEHGDDDRVSQRIKQVQALEARGAEVLVVAAEVTDEASMTAAMSAARDRFGVVHGVVHAAGVLAQNMLDESSVSDFDAVMAPKVRGTLVLERVTQQDDLDFILLCSSISTALGGLGLADYSGANAFLDAFAWCRGPGEAPVISVNWDAWSDVGMAADAGAPASEAAAAGREQFLASAIRADEGRQAFLRALSAGVTQVVVTPQELAPRIARSRRLQDLSEPEVDDAPDAAQTKHQRPKLATEYVAPENELEIELAEVVQTLLGIDRVGLHDNLFELGFDSLMAHRMVARIKEGMQLDLSVRVILESPRVGDLAKYLKAAQWAASAGMGKPS